MFSSRCGGSRRGWSTRSGRFGGAPSRRAPPRGGRAPSQAPAATVSGAPARLLIDVTGVIKRDAGTGIQRVVKKVVEAVYRDYGYEIPVLAARALEGRLYSAHEYAASLVGQPPRAADAEIEPRPGDRFLMLSDSWNAFEESRRCSRAFVNRAAKSSPAFSI